MAVTVINRPIGHRLSGSLIDAVVVDSAGDVLIYVAGGHSLSDGDYVYIESNFESYNGYKYVDSISYDTFKIKNSEGGSYVQFKQEADISFQVSVLNHGWQSVHLPIVYELNSDLWPINTIEESYTNRVVSFAADSNGYTGIAASTNFININSLDYIELIGDGPLAGVYQVLRYIDPDEVIINLAWDASNVFSGYEIRKYYNNYFITVNVYGGLDTDHPWYSERPYELLATLKLIPDSRGDIKFSIAEILKGQLQLRNNTTLDTLPNNLDFWTGFYITYTESYDTSDGEEITVFTSEEVSDKANFQGYAVQSMMPFKSLNSGHMSEYVYTEDYLARWLTLQDRPIAFVDRYFDLSFINTLEDTGINLNIIKSLNGDTLDTEIVELGNTGVGVLRAPILIESGYDQYCIYAFKYGNEGEGPEVQFSIDNFTSSMDSWFNSVDGINPDVSGSPLWAYSSDNGGSIKITTPSGSITHVLVKSSIVVPQEQHFIRIKWQTNYPPSSDGLGIVFYIQDASHSFILTEILTTPVNSSEQESIINISTQSIWEDADSFMITAYTDSLPFVSGDVIHINSIEIYTQELGKVQITEQICIDITTECGNTFTNDELRLTEGGSFRELE